MQEQLDVRSCELNISKLLGTDHLTSNLVKNSGGAEKPHPRLLNSDKTQAAALASPSSSRLLKAITLKSLSTTSVM